MKQRAHRTNAVQPFQPLLGPRRPHSSFWIAALVCSGLTVAAAADDCVPHGDSSLSPWDAGMLMVTALTEFEGDLIAAGGFMDTQTFMLSRWDETAEAWQPLGEHPNRIVLAFAEYDGELIAAGDVVDDPTKGFAFRWDGEAWQPLGSEETFNAAVTGLVLHGEDLVAIGDFTSVAGEAARIARWNGESWQAFGGQISGSLSSVTVYEGDVVVGGGFTSIGGVPANRVARWDGAQWHEFGSGLQFPGGFGTVAALTVYNGDLVAGGAFTVAGGVEALGIARWDGTNWHAIGSGTDAAVTSLAVYDGELVLGGTFTMAGGITVNHIARWDGELGNELEGLGDACPGLPQLGCGIFTIVDPNNPPPPPVWDMAVYSNQLIIGGFFFGAFGEDANGVVAWDGCLDGVPTNRADLDGNGVVDVFDLLILLAQWGPCGDCDTCPADLTGDCTVDVFDLLELLAHWG